MRRFARSRSMPRSRRKRTRRSARVIVHGMLRLKGSCHRSHADFIGRVLIHCLVCAERVSFFEFSLQEKGFCMEMEKPHFVELKEESLEAHGREKVAKNVLAILEPLKSRYVIISYDALSLRTARAMGARRIGWVMRAWNEEAKSKATELVPDYLICNYTKLPKDESEPLWFGPWKWMFYEVTQARLALQLAARGAALIETMAIGEMFKNAHLKRGSCLDKAKRPRHRRRRYPRRGRRAGRRGAGPPRTGHGTDSPSRRHHEPHEQAFFWWF